jgi:protein SCO1/2
LATAVTHEAAAGSALPFPVEITPRFSLTDQTGRTVTEADFAGRPMAIFFGYANCESICSVALPNLAAALDILGPEGAGIVPILITVDPNRDTPEAMARKLPEYHPRLVGLTGSDEALAEARAVFKVEASQVTEAPEGAPIYAHGSFIYLVGRDGEVKSLLPPIMSPKRIAELMQKYL